MVIKANTAPRDIRVAPFGGMGESVMETIITAEQLKGSGRLFSLINIPEGASFGDHTHTGEFEIYYILSGKGTYNDNGVSISVEEGDTFYCDDGETHGIVNTGSEVLKLLAFVGFANESKL